MWYRIGTVSVTSSSPTITGSGTAWAANIRQGWGFIGPDGKTYEVLSVNSNTSITLARNYAGSTLSGQQYDLFPTQGEINTLAAQVAALISSYSGVLTGAGAGKFSAGSAAAPGVSETTDTDTGLAWLAANVLALITGGVERLRVNSSGYLGQRVSAPQYYYDVRAINFGASQAAQGLALRGTSSADLTGAGWLGGLFMETNGSGQNSLSLYGPNVTTAGAVSMQKAVEVFGSGATQDVNIYAGGVLAANFDGVSGTMILAVPASAPALLSNSNMVFSLTSNTNLRVSVRGTDGTTRVANLTLA